MASQCDQSGWRPRRLLKEGDRQHGRQTENGSVCEALKARTWPLDGAAYAQGTGRWGYHTERSPPCCWARDKQGCKRCRTVVVQGWMRPRCWHARATHCPRPLGSPRRPLRHRSSRTTSQTGRRKRCYGDAVGRPVRRQGVGKCRTSARH